MFLLQCVFRVVECNADEQSSSVPLSLGSVAKRFTKQVLHDCRKVASLKQQVQYACMCLGVVCETELCSLAPIAYYIGLAM